MKPTDDKEAILTPKELLSSLRKTDPAMTKKEFSYRDLGYRQISIDTVAKLESLGYHKD